ncbi:MAG: acyl-CoA thioesterase [Candidatus Sericytochromatia bacterium]
MENEVFDYELMIKEFHLDTFGHVNNATYLQIYEEARWELITINNYGIDKIKSTGLGPIVMEINIKYLKELKARDKIKISTQLIDYSTKVGSLKQWITNQNGEICSKMEMKFGLFDTKNRKLVAATDEWLKAIGGNNK